MIECDLGDLVCLHLRAQQDRWNQDPAPRALSAAGLGDALEIGDATAARIRLLHTLQELETEGLVTVEDRAVRGFDTPRPVYRLTAAGLTHAEEVTAAVETEQVVVTNGTKAEVPLSEIDQYFDDAPLVTALARLREDGTVPLETHAGGSFIDREAELETVTDAIRDAFRRECQTVMVSGASGIGKTALVNQATAQITADERNVVTALGVARRGMTPPYDPLRQVIQSLPGEETLERLLGVEDSTLLEVDPDRFRQEREASFDQVAAYLREVATEQPLVIVLENIHAADRGTLALFEALATSITELIYPVAFIGTYRSPALVGQADHPLHAVLENLDEGTTLHELELEQFTKQDTRALIADVVGRQRLPPGFVELVYEQTGGNPLFVRETATHLIERAQVESDQEMFPTDLTSVSLPDEVTTQITHRLDELDEQATDLLRVGALIGERIPQEILTAATDLDPSIRGEYIDLLVSTRLWDRGATDSSKPQVDDDIFVFVSGGVRDAVIDNMDPAVAPDLHRRIADAYETVHGADTAQFAGRIALHADEAGDVERAIEAYRRAGQYAHDTYAHQEALNHFERALELIDAAEGDDDRTRAAIYGDIANVHGIAGDFPAMAEAAATGLELCPDCAETRCELLSVAFSAHTNQGEYDTAREFASERLELAREIDSAAQQYEAIFQLGTIAYRTGNPDTARDHLETSLAFFRERDNPSGISKNLHFLGLTEDLSAEYQRAIQYFEDAIEIRRDLDDPRGEAQSLTCLGLVHQRRNDRERATTCHERALELFEEVGDNDGRSATLNNLGITARKEGEYDRAREYYQRSLDQARENNDRQTEAIALGNLGVLARRQGRWDRADELHRESLQICRDIGDRVGEANSYHRLGVLAARRGEYDRARQHLEQARELFDDIGDSNRKGRTLVVAGEVALDAADLSTARDRLDAARECIEPIDHEILTSRLELAEARVALQADRLAAATEKATAAKNRLEPDGPRHWMGLCYRRLGEIAASQSNGDDARTFLERSLDMYADIDSPHEHLQTYRILLENASAIDRHDRRDSWCASVRDVLEAAPDPVVEVHEAWVADACPEW